MTRPFLTPIELPILTPHLQLPARTGRLLPAQLALLVSALLVSARLARGALVALIRAYQVALAPLLPPACRFYPSCSEYAAQAIQQHGPYGLWLALRRLLKCHPFHSGGYDPPPRIAHRHPPAAAAPAHTD